MPKSLLRARIYWLISRSAHAAYSVFPFLGELRGSVAIIRRDGGFLVIVRNDGRGLGFPGGIAGFKEDPEVTMRREVQEETGLAVERAEFLFSFRLEKPFPLLTHVYEASCRGDIRESWEGVPSVVSLEELEQGVVQQQRRVVDYLLTEPTRS